MIKPLVLVLILSFLMVGCTSRIRDVINGNSDSGGEGGFRLLESDGTEFVSDGTPERIVVISVATAQIMDYLGIELVGITRSMRSLGGRLGELPTVGFPMEPSIEAIMALEPDLVIISSDFKDRHEEKMLQHNIPTYFIDNQTYEDTYKSIEILGKAFRKKEKAEELISQMRNKEQEVLNMVESKNEPAPKVLILFGTGESFMMARETSYAGGLVKMLGGKNITEGVEIKLSGEFSNYLPISIEQVVDLNPEIILRISHGTAEAARMLYEEEFSRNPIWGAVSAHQNNRVYDLTQELFFANPGLKVVEALEELASIIYP